jgi:hypothetical protein
MDNLLNQQSSARSGRGVYSISVAAELSGIPVQSLRLYEQRGLLTPARTNGGTPAATATTTCSACSGSPNCSPTGSTSPTSAKYWIYKTETPNSNPTTPN